ncbi:acyl-CoA dehydrogenase family protein [Conexibacter sp. JD483]|uniref:acyl-CoA dehydrogenase family protein n=1 Tax=unclassified Conexibacter TaxID=2627773 RepID=UPI0027261110|nr:MULTISPECIES: acyl-CoA dehydrogenase family protein [unclassified Conexibacter]MDO8188999.1 acyl-CoA dehydrogenase family protein [Conexibacter sp. CPCC 205706]MDO8201789.1 acyl-CoA dehydrogenase family protein [Conexibacter sp. CPCC 205762]MDR9371522.1 acyl-CoA dehydrogenase family protein [Conexibacter sp. JD483]
MNFDLTDDQREIQRTARALLTARSSFASVRAVAESPARTYDTALWEELIGLGWAGIAIPETYGGQGLGLLELAVVAEQLGWAATPSRWLSNALAAQLVLGAGSERQREQLLPELAVGRETATVGIARDGVAELVPDADSARWIVLVERGQAIVHDARGGGVAIEPRETIDPTRRYARVTVHASGAGAGRLLDGPLEAGLDRAEVVLAAELTGLAQRALELTVAYVQERRQFGTPIGAFQAVSHRAAQQLLETEGARSAIWFAAWAADAEPEALPRAAAMAKAAAADAGRHVTAAAIQLHGGIGFTWEADVHWLYKRAQLDAALLGSASEHRRRIARLAAAAADAAAPGVSADAEAAAGRGHA